jgi:hypothetical protein
MPDEEPKPPRLTEDEEADDEGRVSELVVPMARRLLAAAELES